MKKQLISLSLLTTCISINAFAAGPVANIQVSGDIKPPTCVINAGDSDLLYDLGNISPSVIPSAKPYALPRVENTLVIDCDSQTYLTFKALNNYQEGLYPSGYGTERQSVTFSLVESENTSQVVGGVSYAISSPIVDGSLTKFSRGNDGVSATASWGGTQRILKGATMGWTETAKNGVAPTEMDLVAGKVFTAIIATDTGSDSSGPNTYIFSQNQLMDNEIEFSEGLNYVGDVVLTFNFGV